jgi:hypothetical protein
MGDQTQDGRSLASAGSGSQASPEAATLRERVRVLEGELSAALAYLPSTLGVTKRIRALLTNQAGLMDITRLQEMLEKATPEPLRTRKEPLKLRARHFGDSTVITHVYTADTVAILDDSYLEHEALADLIVELINTLPELLARIK